MILVVTTAASDLDYCGLDMRENLILLHVNIEGKKDQPVHIHSLISTSVIFSLEIMVA